MSNELKPQPPKKDAEPTFRHTARTGVEALLQGIANEIGVDPAEISTIEIRATRGTLVVATKNRAVRALKFKEPEE